MTTQAVHRKPADILDDLQRITAKHRAACDQLSHDLFAIDALDSRRDQLLSELYAARKAVGLR